MKLYGLACFEPRINYTKLTTEKKIVSSNHIEHGRSILWHFNRAHAAVDWSNEMQLHSFRIKRAMHGKTCTSGETDHSQSSRIDTPLFGAFDYHCISSFSIHELI